MIQALVHDEVVIASNAHARPLLPDDVLDIAKSAAARLDKTIVEPRRKVAYAVADFHKDMLRLKADLEGLGKPDEDGKNYKLSQPKAIALILIFLRKWDGKEIAPMSGKDITFADWEALLVNVTERKMGANRDSVLLFDVSAVLAKIVTKFVPDSLAGNGDIWLLTTLSTQSRKKAGEDGTSSAADKEAAWLQKILTSNDKKFLEQTALDFGFGEEKSNPQEATIPASQWNAIVSRLDAEVSPWQNRLNATMQKAQHDIGLVDNFLTKLAEVMRTMLNDARVPLY
jgi:hypothetical protein